MIRIPGELLHPRHGCGELYPFAEEVEINREQDWYSWTQSVLASKFDLFLSLTS